MLQRGDNRCRSLDSLRLLGAALLSLSAACTSLPLVARQAPERWAFTAPWDARSDASARTHAEQLDAVVLDWIMLDTLTGLPIRPYIDSVGRSLPHGTRRLAMVTSYAYDRFHPALIRRLAMDSVALARSATAIAATARSGGYSGLVIDFEGMTGADTALTREVVGVVARAAHDAGLAPVAVAVPASDTVAYPARLFGPSVDLLIVMLYDEHWSTSPPGPIASPTWVRRTLALRVQESGANRVMAALPFYGYVWRANQPVAEVISYDEARRMATEAGVALDRDPASSTLHAVRAGPNGWELWVSDVGLIDALEREVAALGVRRIAYWRLGLEDRAVWK